MSSNVPFSKIMSGVRQPNSHSIGGTYQPAQINGQPILSHLDHLVLTVADIDASVEFYMKVLGMEKEVFGPDDAPRVALKFGMQKINLQHEYAKIQPHAGEATKGSADLCFITKLDIADFLRHLEKLEEHPENWDHPHFLTSSRYFTAQKEREAGLLEQCIRTGARGKIRSVYLRDPDGNLVEVSNYV